MKRLKKALSILLVTIFVFSCFVDGSLISAHASVTDKTEITKNDEVTSDLLEDINEKDFSEKKEQTVNVTFNTNVSSFISGATDSITGPVTTTVGGHYLLFSPLCPAGYMFGGWYLNPQCTGEMIGAYSVVSIAQDHTLYARWYRTSDTTYTVNVMANGGTWPDGTVGTKDLAIWRYVGYKAGDKITITLPVRKGYSMDGWSKYKEGTILTSGNLASISGSTVTVGSENTDLVPAWRPITYTVRYNGNGGDVKTTISSTTYEYDQSFKTLAKNNTTRFGYDFVNWNTKADGSGDSYEAGETVSNLTTVDGATVMLYAQWKAQATIYTISYNTNSGGGTVYGTMPSSIWKDDETFTIPGCSFTRTDGYMFLYWNSKSDGTGTIYRPGDKVSSFTVENNTTIILYAIWAQAYKIAFNPNGASGTTYTKQYQIGPRVVLPYNTFTWIGHKFVGWNTSANGTGTLYEEGETTNSSLSYTLGAVVNLYAQWSPIVYKIQFNNGGSTGDPYTQNVEYDSAVTLIPNRFKAPTNKIFSHWLVTSGNLTGTTFSDEEELAANLASVDGEIVHLTAQWADISYVKYDPNGGTGEAVTVEVATNTAHTLYENMFIAPTGYNFAGWRLNSTTTGTLFQPGQSLNYFTRPGATYTFYAIWEGNTYTVTFDPNGSTDYTGGTVDPESMTVILGSKYGKLPTPAQPTKIGSMPMPNGSLRFDGWFTAQTGGTQVTENTIVSTLSNHTLYAHWTLVSTFVFDANGGSGSMPSVTVEFGTNYVLPECGFTAPIGYEFSSWFHEGSYFKPGTITGTKPGINTVSAEWSPINYTITYDLDGGTLAQQNPTSYNIETRRFILINPTKEGYTFAGWTGTGLSSPTTSVTISAGYTGDRFYKANWTPNTYTVTYDANGGSVSPTSKTVTFDSTYGTLPTPTKTGYTFTGWYTSVSGGTQVTSTTTVDTMSDHTLYANWSANSYHVKFNANGGSGTMDNQVFSYDEPQALTLNTFTRTGYAFRGWSTSNIAKTATYTDGQTVTNLTTTAGGIITLYAVWNTNTYKLTVDPNFGNWEGSASIQTFELDCGATKEISDPVKEGYIFAGWTVSNTSSAINNSVFKMGNADTTITANWTMSDYILTVKPNGGIWQDSPSDQAIGLNFGETYTIPDPTRAGYAFIKWTITGANSTLIDTTFTMGTENATITAVWESSKYTVTFNANGHGTPSISSKEVTYGNSYGELATISENGYTFEGWYLNKDCTGTEVTANTIVEIDNNHTLYAKWTVVTTNTDTDTETDSDKSHSIILNANEGSLLINGFEYITEFVIYGEKGEQIVLPVPIREGYTFVGWNTMLDASGVMIDSNTITSMPNANLNLYAIWEENMPVIELKYGDVNCDGDINMEDVVAMQRIIAQLIKYDDFGEASFGNCDITFDEKVTMEDVVLLQKFIAKLVTDFTPKI